jgi:hypothetical protein
MFVTERAVRPRVLALRGAALIPISLRKLPPF